MNGTRRDFLNGVAATAVGAALGGCAGRMPAAARLATPRFMWAYLAHFGVKMWERRLRYTELKLDETMWNSLHGAEAR